MPELPEVHTTVTGLQKTLPGLRITGAWTDLATRTYTSPHLRESHKDTKFFTAFQKKVSGAKVLSVERRAKNILINIQKAKEKLTILIHMKMTGHIMIGTYTLKKTGTPQHDVWEPVLTEKNEALRDPYNKYIHLVLSLSNKKHLVLSDVRRFAKVTLIDTATAHESIHLNHIGPEPLDASFTAKLCKERLMKRPNMKIKIALLDQQLIAGIGNIYSDEMLFLADIHPMSIVSKIPSNYWLPLYKGMKAVLKKGIDFGGDSTSDYRDIEGKRGSFQHAHNVYRRTGTPCRKRGCNGTIIRLPFGGRSAHFCDIHQKLYS